MKNIDEFMEYCNRLDHQGLINMIKCLYAEDIMDRARIERFEKALELACFELEEKDYKLFDLYDRFDTYHPTHDRYEWKEHLLESVEANE